MKETYISFTSIPARLPHITLAAVGHARLAARHNLSGVCLALQEDAVQTMPDAVRWLVDSSRIELLTIPEDHGSNTKWTLARARHPDARLIVVDDDRIYPDSMVADMLEVAEALPAALLCRAFRALPRPPSPEAPVGYSLARGSPDYAPLATCRRVQDPASVDPRRNVLEHWAGMLYPPGFPDAAFADEAARLAPHDDDVFLTTLATRASIDVRLVPTSDDMIYTRDLAKEIPAVRGSALGLDNRSSGWSRTRDVINRLRGYFW